MQPAPSAGAGTEKPEVLVQFITLSRDAPSLVGRGDRQKGPQQETPLMIGWVKWRLLLLVVNVVY